MRSIRKQREVVKAGSVVAFNALEDAVWFDVVRTEGSFGIVVREAGTNYSEQYADRSMIEQVRAA